MAVRARFSPSLSLPLSAAPPWPYEKLFPELANSPDSRVSVLARHICHFARLSKSVHLGLWASSTVSRKTTRYAPIDLGPQDSRLLGLDENVRQELLDFQPSSPLEKRLFLHLSRLYAKKPSLGMKRVGLLEQSAEAESGDNRHQARRHLQVSGFLTRLGMSCLPFLSILRQAHTEAHEAHRLPEAFEPVPPAGQDDEAIVSELVYYAHSYVMSLYLAVQQFASDSSRAQLSHLVRPDQQAKVLRVVTKLLCTLLDRWEAEKDGHATPSSDHLPSIWRLLSRDDVNAFECLIRERRAVQHDVSVRVWNKELANEAVGLKMHLRPDIVTYFRQLYNGQAVPPSTTTAMSMAPVSALAPAAVVAAQPLGRTEAAGTDTTAATEPTQMQLRKRGSTSSPLDQRAASAASSAAEEAASTQRYRPLSAKRPATSVAQERGAEQGMGDPLGAGGHERDDLLRHFMEFCTKQAELQRQHERERDERTERARQLEFERMRAERKEEREFQLRLVREMFMLSQQQANNPAATPNMPP
ncbi:uncharacterized protein MONBRDRAFT_28581 [Monosiga brevicollis MX1]|uniref:Uncharacterized protein n=1 Tax=Monosiga brevicollis TaxID=81824 RepID=A9V8L1_MONBE|nr:uncharacterized protein MONBRDRAFT_28581 [Monosiga brevicollis MX1]EDQ86102.1 predicted protein [Monosiga brevicollis MX1]|eukprot:XP_001749027.1 hypothetical protein [Monosiga brevicollis MX1]